MVSINSMILSGNLTADPSMSQTSANVAVANFRMANNRYGGDSTRVCFVDVSCFGKQAEAVVKMCHKGTPVIVEGSLAEDTWTTPNGETRFKHYISAFRVHINSSKETPGEDI